MVKLICMIPARKGSRRVPGKALRKVGNTSLLEQAITLALTYFLPSQIYLNTDWDELKGLADQYKINFYRRDSTYASSKSTNDEFMYDFLINTECDRIVQLLPTSPFVLKEEFVSFCNLSN